MRWPFLTARNLLGLLGLCLCLLLPAVSQAESWCSADKAWHFGLSYALAGGTYAALFAVSEDPPLLRAALASGLSLMPGLAKEIYDAGQPDNRFSGADLTYDALGALTGSLSGWLLERWLVPRQPLSLGLALTPRRGVALLWLKAPW